jgi:hypothetical protein
MAGDYTPDFHVIFMNLHYLMVGKGAAAWQIAILFGTSYPQLCTFPPEECPRPVKPAKQGCLRANPEEYM